MKLCECGCGKEVKIETSRFALGHANRSPEVKEKKRLAFIAKYGVDNPSKNPEVQQKKIDTSMRLHGTESPNQSQDVKDRKKKVCLEKYGVENPNQLESIKKKKIDTCLRNHGVRHPMQSDEIYQKGKETLKRNYGVDVPYQCKDIRERGIKTCLENHQVDNPSKNIEIKRKKLDSEILHFGMPYQRTFDGRFLRRELSIRLVEEQKLNGEPLMPRVGPKARICLDELQLLSSYIISREHRLIGYFADGYIEELKLVIEFDEDDHRYQRDDDKQRDCDLTNSGITVFRIYESDWKLNKESIIEKFKSFLIK